MCPTSPQSLLKREAERVQALTAQMQAINHEVEGEGKETKRNQKKPKEEENDLMFMKTNVYNSRHHVIFYSFHDSKKGNQCSSFLLNHNLIIIIIKEKRDKQQDK